MPCRCDRPLAHHFFGEEIILTRTAREQITRTFCGQRSLTSVALLNQLIGRVGAGDGIRTHDPNLGKVVLYP